MIRHIDNDRLLILSTFFLVAVGIIMVYSTSFIVAQQRFGDEYFFVKKHVAFALLGLSAFL
ncbi:MAG: FtsW/RodA/SpoVE family cell cycle protein, partial [Deltaproteobacteria bacterium]|nr:FtsW/RodA/SpoVE family cell cycle protein [Deltaproteobacteria bacterium]